MNSILIPIWTSKQASRWESVWLNQQMQKHITSSGRIFRGKYGAGQSNRSRQDHSQAQLRKETGRISWQMVISWERYTDTIFTSFPRTRENARYWKNADGGQYKYPFLSVLGRGEQQAGNFSIISPLDGHAGGMVSGYFVKNLRTIVPKWNELKAERLQCETTDRRGEQSGLGL